MRKDLPVKLSMLSTVLRPVVLPMAAALALTLSIWSPAAAAGPSIFVDNNDNGVFDAGDVDVSLTLKLDGKVETDHSIVVPEGSVLRIATETASLRAEKGIRVAGTVTASGSLFLRTEFGPIAVGPRSSVTAYGTLQMTAGTDLVLDSSTVRAYDVAMFESLSGQILVNKGLLYGATRLDLNGFALDGGLKVAGASLQAPRGLINVHVEGTVELEQAKLTSVDLNVTVAGGYAEICWSTVRVAGRTGTVMVSVESVPQSGALAAGSFLDLTGTKVYASAGNVVMNADQMVGY
jgi:hypothetical protein